MANSTATTTFAGPNGEIEVCTAKPDGGGPFPGVLLRHEGLGLTQRTKRRAKAA